MYADRVEAASKLSVKERLNGNVSDDYSRRRQITGKRQRQDDKWEHDLYQDEDEPQVSNHRVDARDLRLKLQRKKSLQRISQSGKASGVRDLREKLSGTMHPQPKNADPPKSKAVAAKTGRKNVVVEATESDSKQVPRAPPRKKTKQKADSSVEDFLMSLDLEKYVITFQAEEVDMDALMHMTDEDLKAMSIPMGPRKKILLALESRP